MLSNTFWNEVLLSHDALQTLRELSRKKCNTSTVATQFYFILSLSNVVNLVYCECNLILNIPIYIDTCIVCFLYSFNTTKLLINLLK